MPKIQDFEELICWQKSRELVNEIYSISNDGDFSRDFELKNQTRRAAISIMSNIAEGFGRYHKKEFVRFLDIAQSSASELKSQLYIALDQNYITKEQFSIISVSTNNVRKLIFGLVRYLKNYDRPGGSVKEPESEYSVEGTLNASYSIPENFIDPDTI
ncbi:MAG: four helix bundle protein [Candidatus Marinimicrobia bacterium]|nr:four helix bundle protein [Candidatus Neomarinimicrobiota bacterium]MCF7827772.1 four helix bundle protein [Candidatus Neomarinimicrobiota bacterium]MCF7879473.1 four helix bundle protein [Candidatus Neomarinimicrobiota bacterium]